MKYTKQLLKDKRVEVTINVTKKEWDDALEHAYEHTKGKYDIQGFRKGHAPRKVIEKSYGDTVFYDDAIDDCFYRYYFEVLKKEKDIEPVSAPEINISKIDENGLELVLKITTKPDVALKDYKGLTIEKKKVKVTKEEVDHRLMHLRESRVSFEEVDRPASLGDTVTIDFSGSIGGKKFEGGTSTDYDLELGSHSFIDNFEDQLVGSKKDDKKDVVVTFPKDYPQGDLAGKEAVFEVNVKSVKEKHLPELNDEFADEVSEFSTLEELKSDIEKKILEQKTHEEDLNAENRLVEKIVDAAEVEIPKVMVDEQVEDYIKDFERRLQYQGLSLDGYLKYAGTTLEDLKKSRRDDAKKTVKTRLVLEKIVSIEKIKVTDKDIEKKYNEHEKDNKKSAEEIRNLMGEEQYNYFENSLLLNKLMAFLKENNKIE